MGAFDPLFRGRRRSFGRRAAPGMMMGGGKIGSLVGLAGLGYAAYRFLQTERGRAVQSNVVEHVRNFGERVRAQSEDLGTRWSKSKSGASDLGETQL
ncbi:MAG: hypothetical protein ACAI38_25975 [Myxococcota bacterium]